MQEKNKWVPWETQASSDSEQTQGTSVLNRDPGARPTELLLTASTVETPGGLCSGLSADTRHQSRTGGFLSAEGPGLWLEQ